MKHEVIERLETLLRDEGFTNLSTLRSSHDVTISAAKGDTRLVDPKVLQQVWEDFAPYRDL